MPLVPITQLPEDARLVHYNNWIGTFDFQYEADCVINEFVEKLQSKGYDLSPSDVRYSGFWNQGDGASFDATISVEKWIVAHGKEHEHFLMHALLCGSDRQICIKASGVYQHEKSMHIDMPIDVPDVIVDGIMKGEDTYHIPYMPELNALENDILKTSRDYATTLYRRLELSYEEATSIAAFHAECEANDWLFDNSGEDDPIDSDGPANV